MTTRRRPTMSRCDIAGTHEVAARLGVEYRTVRAWRTRDLGFPAPTWQLASGPVWDWTEIAAWAEATGRTPGQTKGN